MNNTNLDGLKISLDEINSKLDKALNDAIVFLSDKIIKHKLFGDGKLIKNDNAFIFIEFDNNVIKKFKIPDSFLSNYLFIDEDYSKQFDEIAYLNERSHKLSDLIQEISYLKNGKWIDYKNIICSEAKSCIERGYICVNDDVEFKTIRDVSDLFNKQYKGCQKSWIKIGSDWKKVASCYKMSSPSDSNLYSNVLSDDGNCFYYLINESSDSKKLEAVNGIIEHEMEETYLFLKFPEAYGYKFVGVFVKDVDKMKKSIADGEYKVIYKKIDDKLNLTQFWGSVTR